jgi:hypothetical protein
MRTKILKKRRVVSVLTAVALVVAVLSLTGIGSVGACEQQLKVSGVARGYDVADDGRALDGIVVNDTSKTVDPGEVKIGWLESPNRIDEQWVCSGPLAPGEWAAFSGEWPEGVPTTWTPVVIGYASIVGDDAGPLPLTVSDVSEPATDECGFRSYTITITNPNAFAVSSIDVSGIERDAGSDEFVDVLDGCGPDSLAAGESRQIDIRGKSSWDGALSTDIKATGLEQPSLTLSANTLTPDYGSLVTFKLDLKRADGSPATGCRTLKLFTSHDGEDWNDDYRCLETKTGSVQVAVMPDSPTYYKAVYWGGDDLGNAESDVLFVQPQAANDAPQAPNVVRARKPFKVHGCISAGPKSTGKPVTIITERKCGSRWIKTATVKTTADAAGRYVKSIKLTTTGTYRIRAYRTGVGYSAYKSLQVKK